MLVAKSGLPQYQEIVSAVLAGGATSLTDSLPPSPLGAAGAENTRSGRTGEHASLLSIAGDCGVGKTTALLMLAHDVQVRVFFRFVLFLSFGEDATDADVFTKLATLARISGGRNLANQIVDSLRGKDQVSTAVSLLKQWLGPIRVLLVLDNVWPRASGLPWAEGLSAVVPGDGSTVLLSTRQGS
jgi:NB-ARC domain